MAALPYIVIKNEKQYYYYCKVLEGLVALEKRNKQQQDIIALLTSMIEHWDDKHDFFEEIDPIRLLQSLMDDHKMKARDLVELLGVSKEYVSDFLNYKKGLSKDVIRKLAQKFKLSQDAFSTDKSYMFISTEETVSTT